MPAVGPCPTAQRWRNPQGKQHKTAGAAAAAGASFIVVESESEGDLGAVLRATGEARPTDGRKDVHDCPAGNYRRYKRGPKDDATPPDFSDAAHTKSSLDCEA